MEIDKIIEKVIDEVLDENKQPFKEEFKAFIKHIMMGNHDDDEIKERINAVKTKQSGSDK